jgi:hypothetical protein
MWLIPKVKQVRRQRHDVVPELYKSFILNELAERVGFEIKVQRTFNNMQGQR